MIEKKLLIIDDDAEIAQLVRRVAERIDYRVEVAANAHDFMRLYDEFKPSVVLLDIIMPDIDGLELLAFLRGKKCRCRVVIMSGYDGSYLEVAEKLGEAYGLAPLQTLKKPLEIADLRLALT